MSETIEAPRSNVGGTMRVLNGSPRSSSSQPREKDDYYKTPPASTLALLSVERFPHVIHEPSCGDGAISEVLNSAGYEVHSSDLIDRGYGTPGQDFLQQKERICSGLVTNPPFGIANEYTAHALDLGYSHIALLMRLAWLEGTRRHKTIFSTRPPCRVWVFSGRQTLWRGDEPNPGKGGAMAFAWFVWQKGHSGTQIGWLA